MDGATQRVWIPALPQGWEARYDHSQRRYFFLNHATKQTQWEDPRFQKPSAASAASSLGSNTNSSSRASHSATSRSGEAVAMRDLSPRHSAHTSRGNNQQEESSLSSQMNTAVITKLHREFPRATKELITDLFQLCHENERETREQLKDLGFLKDTKPSHTQQPARQKSPERRQPAAKPELSDSQKRQLANQLKSHFPKLEANVITIALSTCDYDVESTKKLLQAWSVREGEASSTSGGTSSTSGGTSSTSGGASSTSGGASSRAASSTSSRPSTSATTRARAPASLEPAGLASSEDTSPRPMRTDGPSSLSSAGSRRNVPGPSLANTGARAGSPSHQPPHLTARQVTKLSEHLLNTTGDLLNHLATTASCCVAREQAGESVGEEPRPRGHNTSSQREAAVTTQPATRHASHSSVAKGPDASLRKGPDSSLLIDDYEAARGPDRSLRQGPDHSRVTGPMGACGADPTLRCGPQGFLATGSMAITNLPLVSHI